MPVTITQQKPTIEVQRRTFNDGRPDAVWLSPSLIRETRLDKPLTVKRAYPIDEWVSGTQRKVMWISYGDVQPMMESYWTAKTAPYGYYDVLRRYPTAVPTVMTTDVYTSSLSWGPLISQLLLKIKAEKTNLGVSLVELGKTTDMVFDILRGFSNLFRMAKRAKRLDWLLSQNVSQLKRSKFIAGKWLQWSFGLKPLAADVYGQSEWLYQKIREGIYFYVSVKQPIEKEVSQTAVRPKYTYHCTGTQRLKARFKVDNANLRSLTQAGITNPSEVLWELVPFSFLVDYFIGVGDYLASLDALNGVYDVSAQGSYGHITRFSFYDMRALTGGFTLLDSGSASGIQTVRNRKVYLPPLVPQIPKYEPSLNATRVLNIIALLRSLRKH